MFNNKKDTIKQLNSEYEINEKISRYILITCIIIITNIVSYCVGRGFEEREAEDTIKQLKKVISELQNENESLNKQKNIQTIENEDNILQSSDLEDSSYYYEDDSYTYRYKPNIE